MRRVSAGLSTPSRIGLLGLVLLALGGAGASALARSAVAAHPLRGTYATTIKGG